MRAKFVIQDTAVVKEAAAAIADSNVASTADGKVEQQSPDDCDPAVFICIVKRRGTISAAGDTVLEFPYHPRLAPSDEDQQEYYIFPGQSTAFRDESESTQMLSRLSSWPSLCRLKRKAVGPKCCPLGAGSIM